MGLADGVNSIEFIPDDGLVAGTFPLTVRVVTITGGQPLPRGAVLGQVNANRFYQLSEAAASDGSEVPDAILAEAVDATEGDVHAHVYLSGSFNAQLLTLGAGHSLSDVDAALRQRSLFLRGLSDEVVRPVPVP